ncbi:MAG TPA: hypothetical protein PKW55_06080 [Spirochaetota bacterium]|nr:hypothetical protein [Spirochaetota bacterium]HOM38451.1 hypothetical protein [Spirochaetota bacterium]HPQ48991.1 hypothetical protein [Spirochaetota bacterium]
MKFYHFFLNIFFTLILVSCFSDRLVKTDESYNFYIINGYVSSRKDSVSLDIFIEVDRIAKVYKIECYDTLLGKKRFIIIIQNDIWEVIDEKGHKYRIDLNDPIFDILPDPSIFNYISFFYGKTPYLINPDKVEEKNNEKIYYRGDYIQKLYFSDKKLEYFEIYRGEKKFFKFEYKGYIEIINDKESMIFPKLLYIYDYKNFKKIEWWFDSVKFGSK